MRCRRRAAGNASVAARRLLEEIRVHPELAFTLAGARVAVSSHALAVALGVAAGFALALRRARNPTPALAAAAATAVAALAGAHWLFRAMHGGEGRFWSGGLASTGGVATGLGAVWVTARLTRRPARELLDALAPAGILALAIGRIGCFLAGCCYGRPSAVPWAVVFPDLGPPARHPLQLYSAASDLGLLLLLSPSRAAPGTVARRACIGLGLVRFALEILRDPGATDALVAGWLTLPQAGALLLVAGAALGLRVPAPFDYGIAAEDERACPTRRA
ncbi:MAG: hypothetical protein E6J55_25335 [Deltaproteobacteria bacterium]|nr:MAG: hypothetical protein E6J55_25335 [Deltaproteobacteria bacterium]